jgi:isoprenylcysteine carboxyl methyltransferase (ICMT) family protein YpbQ
MSIRRHQALSPHSSGQISHWVIARSMGVLLSGSVTSRLFAAVSLIVMARSVGPTAFGQFVASITVVRLSSLLFSLGMDQWLLRNGGQAWTQATMPTMSIAAIKLLLGAPLVNCAHADVANDKPTVVQLRNHPSHQPHCLG